MFCFLFFALEKAFVCFLKLQTNRPMFYDLLMSHGRKMFGAFSLNAAGNYTFILDRNNKTGQLSTYNK